MARDLGEALEEFTDAVSFERLCCDVLVRQGYEAVEPQGVGRRDGGKDAIAKHPIFGTVLCQFSTRRDWRRKLEEDIDAAKSTGLRFDHFVFVTSRRSTVGERARAKQLIRERLDVTAEIFDQERLRVAISADSDLRADYFPALSNAAALETLADTLRSLVDQGLVIPSNLQIHSIPAVVATALESAVRDAVFGKPDSALETVSNLAETFHSLPGRLAKSITLVGGSLFYEGWYEQAAECWRHAVELDDQAFEPRFNLAVASEHDSTGRRYGRKVDTDTALELHRQALAVAKTPSEEAMCLDNMGTLHVLREEKGAARIRFAAARKRDPHHHTTRLNLATLSPEPQRRLELEEMLGTDADVVVRLNLALALLGVHPVKATELVQGVEEWPNGVDGDAVISRVALANDDLEKARASAERRLKTHGDWADAHQMLGCIALRQGDFSVAAAAYEAALGVDPDTESFHVGVAQAWRHLGGAQAQRRAIECLQKASSRWPESEEIHLLLGLVCRDELPATARIAFRRVVQINPRHVEALFNLGVCAEDEGTRTGWTSIKDREAIGHYLRALEVDPLYGPALTNLGTCLGRQGDHEAAIPYLVQAVQVDPANTTALGNLGVAYVGVNRLGEARQAYERILEIDPENPYARHNLAGLGGILIPDRLPTR